MTVISNNTIKLVERDRGGQELEMKLVPKNILSTVDGFDSSIKSPKFNSSVAIIKRPEEAFIKNLDLSTYGMIAKNFIDTYKNSNNKQFYNIENLLIEPTAPELMLPRLKMAPYADEQVELEEWHERHAYKFAEELLDADEDTRIRHKKREELGLGFGGKMSDKTVTGKEIGHFAKDNLTIRGNMVKLTDALCGRSIYEMLPLYATRKGAKISVAMSSMAINAILSATGHALIPVSFGISKVVTDQMNTVVTLSGEAITGKILGATNGKIATHAGIRGIQLEIPNITPGGVLIQYYEMGMDTGGSLTIAASSIADIILRNTSKRYASIISESDLGDERVLFEMNQRIDYLSKFLIPYGQYLLLRTTNPETIRKIRYILKEQMEVLRDLEKTKTKALNFYQLAILAERLIPERREGIEAACRMAVPNTQRNTHKMVRRCLATLLRERPIGSAS